jgi:hypothetical protein
MVDIEAQTKSKSFWDGFSKGYKAEAEMTTLQPTLTCYNFSRVHTAKRILEVASGTGLGASLMFSTYL